LAEIFAIYGEDECPTATYFSNFKNSVVFPAIRCKLKERNSSIYAGEVYSTRFWVELSSDSDIITSNLTCTGSMKPIIKVIFAGFVFGVFLSILLINLNSALFPKKTTDPGKLLTHTTNNKFVFNYPSGFDIIEATEEAVLGSDPANSYSFSFKPVNSEDGKIVKISFFAFSNPQNKNLEQFISGITTNYSQIEIQNCERPGCVILKNSDGADFPFQIIFKTKQGGFAGVRAKTEDNAPLYPPYPEPLRTMVYSFQVLTLK